MKNKLNILSFTFIASLAVFAVYVMTTSSTISFYRDSGELVTSAYTLSVAHSPGYPLYMIIGKFFISLLGLLGLNPAYSMNIMSSFFGAGAVFFIILAVEDLTENRYAALFSGLLAGFTCINWMLSVVAEMYSLSFFFTAVLFYLMLKKKHILFSFIFALSLGNHLSILFAVLPMAAVLFVKRDFKNQPIKESIIYFILGLSVYMYLPIRAIAGPFINWGDPSTLKSFLAVVTRSAYGHTLDLVSREVTLGQVFLPQIGEFSKALLRDITLPGLLFALIGIYYGFKNKKFKKVSFVLAGIFFLTGPYFLYLAKMPVNPHAQAIVEVGYMASELVLAVFAALGLAVAVNKFKSKKGIIFSAALLIALYSLFSNWSRVDKSGKYFADDYAVNILSSVGPDSIVIMRRDHTMFALWYKNYVENFKPEVKVISKGLLSAGWYREKLQQDFPDIEWKDKFMSDENYISWLIDNYNDRFDIYMTPAAAGELTSNFHKKYKTSTYGLIEKISGKEKETKADKIYSEVLGKYKYRGNYNAEAHYGFFEKDFITLYARAYDRIGTEFLKERDLISAEKAYKKAISFKEDFPEPYSNMAYIYMQKGNFEKSKNLFIKSIQFLKANMKKYTRKSIFKNKLSRQYNNLGAVYEKLFRQTNDNKYFKKALESYNFSIEYDDKFARTYFNLGVLYWNRDWEKSALYFKKALKYDPNNKEALNYYKITLQKIKNLRNRR